DEAVAAIFVIKWAGEAVLAVRALTAAIGLGGAVAGGTLLAALAGIAAVVGLLAVGSKYETPENRAAIEKRRRDQDTRSPTNMPTQDGYYDQQGRWIEGPIQKQSGRGGYLPGGVTPAAYQPGAVAARQPMEF